MASSNKIIAAKSGNWQQAPNIIEIFCFG